MAGAAASLGLLANPAAAGGQKTLRYAFPAPESTFDPPSTNSDFYSSTLISQILEAPLTYDYLARPVRLMANTAEHLPEVSADGLTITLRIRPQIGEGGSIRMTLYQEQSSVKATTAAGTSNAGPSTTKRSIESTIVVDDGQIIVLGGLIEDRFVESESKVPLLGDLPGIGGLFRSTAREKRRSNLMVFLRPVVLRDPRSTQSLSADRYELMRAIQQVAQPEPSRVLPINEAPALPTLPGNAAPPAAQPTPVPAR